MEVYWFGFVVVVCLIGSVGELSREGPSPSGPATIALWFLSRSGDDVDRPSLSFRSRLCSLSATLLTVARC